MLLCHDTLLGFICCISLVGGTTTMTASFMRCEKLTVKNPRFVFEKIDSVQNNELIAFDEGERCLFTWFLPAGLIVSRGYRSRCQSISGFGRHLGLAHLASIPFGLAHVASIPCVTTASSKTIRYH